MFLTSMYVKKKHVHRNLMDLMNSGTSLNACQVRMIDVNIIGFLMNDQAARLAKILTIHLNNG